MKKSYQNFWGQTTPIWWEIWGSKTPKVSCTKLGMLFQNDDQMSKLKELTKISRGKVWSDRSKLTIIVCHLIRIVLPNYYSLYYLGWISEMLGTGENHILSSLCCSKNLVFGYGKRDIERKLESRGCFSIANILHY